MKRLHKTLALMLASVGLMAGNALAQITIDSVHVLDAGNPPDPTTGYGAVGYDYYMGKYEVTLAQYTAFLNAVAKTDTYNLYNTSMSTILNTAGITRSGAVGTYSYSVIGTGTRPVTFVNWFDAARFVNWIQNGQPTGLQNATTTETGAYTLNGALSGVTITKNANAQFWIPNENEWYKAAYYQPAAQGGDVDNYWLYPTASNVIPNSRNGSGSDPNSANFNRDDAVANGYNGGYAVSQSPLYAANQQYLTAAGAFSVADSFYGTFDQGGNVWEWNDTVIGSGRGMRGGSWANNVASQLSSSGRSSNSPTAEVSILGFRIAIVPEPTVGGLMILGMALLAWQRKR